MSRWADSTDDDDDYLNEGDHEDYIEHAVGADEVSFGKNSIQNADFLFTGIDDCFVSFTESHECLSSSVSFAFLIVDVRPTWVFHLFWNVCALFCNNNGGFFSMGFIGTCATVD